TKYNDALKIIKAALQKYPQNDILKSKRDYYQSFEPKKLTAFHVFDQYNVRVNDGQKDSLGNIHNGVIETGFIEEKGYICYVLDGTYNKLTFNCYGISPSYNSMESISIRDISSGDYDTSTTLYLNENVKSSALPFKVEVDISGVKIVRVWCTSRVAISDAQVQRTVK
ncbi:MAG: hypothetical protein IJA13_00095, partial [Clostridia bacterium]|nr:hypothetical protein [Clostridia bacterium]